MQKHLEKMGEVTFEKIFNQKLGRRDLQCESNPPQGFLKFFPKRLGIFNQFLHTYFAIISTLDYKFLFKYLQL